MSNNPPAPPAPSIPQRPARSPPGATTTTTSTTPSPHPPHPPIPARPRSRIDRPRSPALVNAYAPSPLNQRPDSPGKPSPVLQPAHHPPTVKIPSIGQEGVEYADYDRLKAEADAELDAEAEQQQQQTRSVAHDLKLHSPRPSSGPAQAKVSSIARNGLDSTTAPAARPSLSSRPSSLYADSEGGSDRLAAAQPGTRVPMYPGAGEVQAPTPRPESARPAGTGEGARPPDSYGLHSHEGEPVSRLDREWYEKHPEARVRKEKVAKALHGPRLGDALSSDALNKLVRDTARKNEPRAEPGYMGTPDEEIGYRASDQLVSRLHLSRPSSRPASVRSASRNPDAPSSAPAPTSGPTPSEQDDLEGVSVHIDARDASPHRPPAAAAHGDHEPAREPAVGPALTTEHAADTHSPVLAADEVDTAHHLPAAIPPLEWKTHSRASSTNGRPRSFVRRSPAQAEGQLTPPSAAAAAQPEQPQQRAKEQDDKPLFTREPEDEQARLDRFKNRPNLAEHRFPSKDVWEDSPDSTHLETVVDAPEPVADAADADADAEGEASEANNPQAATPRATPPTAPSPPPPADSALHAAAAKEFGPRPGLARASSSFDARRHHFPSKDIWEDAPDSAHLEATIQAPEEEVPSETVSPIEPSALAVQFRRPVVPARPARPVRKGGKASEEGEGATAAAPVVAREKQPDQKQEQKQEKQQEKQQENQQENQQEQKPEEPQPAQVAPASAPAPTPAPAAAPAPAPAETKRQPPMIPGRPKPQIPARPTRHSKSPGSKQDSPPAAIAPLSRTTSAASAGSAGSANNNGTTTDASPAPATSTAPTITTTAPAPAPPKPKPKPAIPARPVGSKIAALQAGFLSDLNNRLKIGPRAPAPKPAPAPAAEAAEESKPAPLGDARKGRAKGPVRRKPAAKVEEKEEKGEVRFEIVKAWGLYGVGRDGRLVVNAHVGGEKKKEGEAKLEGTVKEEKMKEEVKAEEKVKQEKKEEKQVLAKEEVKKEGQEVKTEQEKEQPLETKQEDAQERPSQEKAHSPQQEQPTTNEQEQAAKAAARTESEAELISEATSPLATLAPPTTAAVEERVLQEAPAKPEVAPAATASHTETTPAAAESEAAEVKDVPAESAAKEVKEAAISLEETVVVKSEPTVQTEAKEEEAGAIAGEKEAATEDASEKPAQIAPAVTPAPAESKEASGEQE